RNRNHRWGGSGGERRLSRHRQTRSRSADHARQTDMKDIYDILREWKKRCGSDRHFGSEFALATLVRVEGSSYRRPGARMLICESGNMIGSLSAGCVEEEIAVRARDVLRTGQPTLMSFDTQKRFGCAGKIYIFIACATENFFV